MITLQESLARKLALQGNTIVVKSQTDYQFEQRTPIGTFERTKRVDLLRLHCKDTRSEPTTNYRISNADSDGGFQGTPIVVAGQVVAALISSSNAIVFLRIGRLA